ncbi:MAG: hypothetical protein HSCHL_1624 [Hydrogenibacillus schlegelii]|uniref:Uncharacterized protein n=1 Tax=Hydrogenibacillus schlegelii TaxID=1484 RepID=A0A2T5G4B4_HYDSH|nr:hypothetical protein [Hydrogenibacillus schlegelii]PTQ51034.1 MAG: hypothetical protein HSCHL_1624 [Hydrogenibacillus schlegelii]
MRITATAIADLIDRVGGVYSYSIDYDSRRVFLTTMSGERVEMTFDDILRWVVEQMKRTVH